MTLTQQFVPVPALETVFARVDAVLRGHASLAVRVTGVSRASSSVSLALERTTELARLHAEVMAALMDLECPDGDVAAFANEARAKDVAWVRGFRRDASAGHFAPHVTLGHTPTPPDVPSFEAMLDVAAVCHLGRFCSCRRILRQWDLP